MTISTESNKVENTATVGVYIYGFTFKILADTDIKLYINGVLKTLNTHYTVTGAGSENGGSVVIGSSYVTAGDTVLVKRVVPLTQGTDFVDNAALPAQSLENGLDKSIMAAQQLQEALNRAVKLADHSTKAPPFLKDPPTTPNGEIPQLKASGAFTFLQWIADPVPATQAAQTAAEAAKTSAETAKAGADSAKTAAETAKTAAEAARDKAQKWADETVDVVVESGKYSAKHHANKAAQSAAAINLPAIQSGDAGKTLAVKSDLTGYELTNSAGAQTNINTQDVFLLNMRRLSDHSANVVNTIDGLVDDFQDGATQNNTAVDLAGSTGATHDNTNKLWKNTPGGTGLNADQDYTTEGNYETYDYSGTTATIATNTITITSGTFPSNAVGMRFSPENPFNPANSAAIETYTDSTHIVLVSGHGLTASSSAWTLRSFQIATGVAKLATATVAGGYGSDVTGGQTYSDGGAGTADNPPANAFDNDETVTNWRRLTVLDTDTTWVAVQFSAAKTITKIRVKPRGADGGANSSVKNWILYGSNSAAGTGGTSLTSGTAANTVDVYFEATFSNSTAYTYYTFAITSDYLAGSHNRSVWEIEMMEGGSTTVNVINEYVPVIPAYANLADSSAFSDINSLARTETLNSANVWYLAFVNAQSGWGANTELGVWNGTPVYRRVVQNVAGTWKFNSNATFTSETMTAAAVNTLAGAIREALTVAANQMTGATMAAVTDAALTVPTGKAGIVAILYSTVNSNNPQVDQTRVNYDSQASAISLVTRAFGGTNMPPAPASAPTTLVLEILEKRVSGTSLVYEVSRDGGTTWAAVSTWDINDTLADSTIAKLAQISVTGQPSGTSPKCRIRQTATGESYELHAIGLKFK